MPKNSSKSNKSISPEQVLFQNKSLNITAVVCLVLLIVGGSIFLLKKKPVLVTSVLPSGAMVYLRLDHPADHVQAFRQSRFWKDYSKIDWAKYLEVQGRDPKQIEEYKDFQKSAEEFLDSPLFKQFFSKEAAVALYPSISGFSNGDWPEAFSGFVVVVRPEMKTKILELINKTLGKFNQEWVSTQQKYNQETITTIKFKNAAVALFYARMGEFLFISVDERLLQRIINTSKTYKDQLSEDQHFVSLSRQFYSPSDGEMVVNMPVIKKSLEGFLKKSAELLGAEKEIKAENTGKILEAFEGVNSVGHSFVLSQPLRLKWLVHFDPSTNNVVLRGRAMDRCVTINKSPVTLIPKDALVYNWSSCWDFSKLYQELSNQFETIKKTSSKKMPPLMEYLQKSWGISVQEDIIPILEGEWGWFIHGVEADGMFPVPKAGFVIKVKDQAAAEEVLRKLSSTPLTNLQTEDYRNFAVHYISVPLVNTFKPSYTLIDGNVFITSTLDLAKKIIDAKHDPSSALAGQEMFKQGFETQWQSYHTVNFVNFRGISKQGLELIQWAQRKFDQSVKQTLASEDKLMQSLQEEERQIVLYTQKLEESKGRLNALNGELKSLEDQAQASSVVMEAENTLSQEGPLKNKGSAQENSPEKFLAMKKPEVSALELEIKGLERDLNSTQTRKAEIQQRQQDLAQVKIKAEKYHYYVNEVIVPLLQAVDNLSVEKSATQFTEGVLTSELFLTVQ